MAGKRVWFNDHTFPEENGRQRCPCCEYGKDGTMDHTELSYAVTVKTSTGEHDDFASCSNHVDNYRRAGFAIRKLRKE